MKIKKKTIIIFVSAAVLVFTAWVAWGNTALELNTYTVESSRLPEVFDGFRIAQVSDLHNTELDEDNEGLISLLREAQPDIIAITGDMIDSRHTDIEIALQFAEEAVKIAPCYYVTGNHEARVEEYETLKKGLTELGVTVLGDERTVVERNGESIAVYGVNDPVFGTSRQSSDAEAMDEKLKAIKREDDKYIILLSHRPELFDVYVENGVDLVLSGHAHGGQFRLPIVGGLVAPNQGLFPEYDAGLFRKGNTSMIVSRGIGNSIIPFRVNNRPEIVIVELRVGEEP